MKIKDLYGRERNISIRKYEINWDKQKASKFQFSIKEFLKPFWKNHVVLEEFVIPSSRYRIDILNISKHIAIEVSGVQHERFVKHFHRNKNEFLNSWNRDSEKEAWIKSVGFKFVEIFPKDLPNISRQWFIDKYDIDII